MHAADVTLTFDGSANLIDDVLNLVDAIRIVTVPLLSTE